MIGQRRERGSKAAAGHQDSQAAHGFSYPIHGLIHIHVRHGGRQLFPVRLDLNLVHVGGEPADTNESDRKERVDHRNIEACLLKRPADRPKFYDERLATQQWDLGADFLEERRNFHFLQTVNERLGCEQVGQHSNSAGNGSDDGKKQREGADPGHRRKYTVCEVEVKVRCKTKAQGELQHTSDSQLHPIAT